MDYDKPEIEKNNELLINYIDHIEELEVVTDFIDDGYLTELIYGPIRDINHELRGEITQFEHTPSLIKGESTSTITIKIEKPKEEIVAFNVIHIKYKDKIIFSKMSKYVEGCFNNNNFIKYSVIITQKG